MAKKVIFSQERLKELISKYNNGISLRKLELDFKVSRRTLSNMLKENNVLIKDNTVNSRKYNHNEDYFKTIDTEHKAYWLGFMYADGFIESKRQHGNQKFGITLSSIDIKHLEKFRNDLQSNNPIKIYKGGGFNSNSEFSKILLTSQKTVNDLIAQGCVEQKTFKLKFPTEEQVPKELVHHFIRGYFDGDGSLSYYMTTRRCYKASFVGTYDFIISTMNHLNKNLKLHTKEGTTYQLSIGGNLQVKYLMNYLYNNATIYLDRKYEKYIDLLKYSES